MSKLERVKMILMGILTAELVIITGIWLAFLLVGGI